MEESVTTLTPHARHAATAWIGIAIFALIASAFTTIATRHGPGVSPDSIVYLAAARSIANGAGVAAPAGQQMLMAPMTHFPPIYPAMIAATRPFTARPMSAARWIGIVLAGLNVIGVALLAHRATAGNLLATWVAAGLAAVSVDLLTDHVFAYSEPPVLLLTSAVVLLLDRHLRQRSTSHLLTAASLAAIACLTRYAAIALIAAGVVGIVIVAATSMRRRLIDAAVFASPAMLAMLGWMARNRHLTGTAASRPIVWHFGSDYQFKTLAKTLYGLLADTSLGIGRPWIGGALVATLLLVLVVALVANNSAGSVFRNCSGSKRLKPVISLLVLFIAMHLILSMIVLEPDMPLDPRLMSPTVLPGIALLAAAASIAYSRRRWTRPVIFAATGLALASGLISLSRTTRQFAIDGAGYNKARWRDAPVLVRTLALPSDIVIVSNAADVIQHLDIRRRGWAGNDLRRVHLLPSEHSDARTMLGVRQLLRHHAVLLYAEGVRGFLLSEADVQRELPVTLIERDDVGFALYRYSAERDVIR